MNEKANAAWDAYIVALFDYSVPYSEVMKLKEKYLDLTNKVCFCGTKLPANHPEALCYSCIKDANLDYYNDFHGIEN